MKRLIGVYALLEKEDIEQLSRRQRRILLLVYSAQAAAVVGIFAHMIMEVGV